jgi:cold shock CspA family protein
MNRIGKIKYYNTHQKFGFIREQGDDEDHYFNLKISKTDISSDEIRTGIDVSFTSDYLKKGWTVQEFNSVNLYPHRIIPYSKDSLHVSREERLPRNHSIILLRNFVTVEHKSPHIAKNKLMQKCISAKYNALLNFRIEKRTARSWTNSNYKYTVHIATGQPAVIAYETQTDSYGKYLESKSKINKAIKANTIRSKFGLDFTNTRKAISWSVMAMVVIVIFI